MAEALTEQERSDLLKQQRSLLLESARLIAHLDGLLWRQARLAAALAERGYPEQFAHELVAEARRAAERDPIEPALTDGEARLGNQG